jgi:hypothetical protein
MMTLRVSDVVRTNFDHSEPTGQVTYFPRKERVRSMTPNPWIIQKF